MALSKSQEVPKTDSAASTNIAVSPLAMPLECPQLLQNLAKALIVTLLKGDCITPNSSLNAPHNCSTITRSKDVIRRQQKLIQC